MYRIGSMTTCFVCVHSICVRPKSQSESLPHLLGLQEKLQALESHLQHKEQGTSESADIANINKILQKQFINYETTIKSTNQFKTLKEK